MHYVPLVLSRLVVPSGCPDNYRMGKHFSVGTLIEIALLGEQTFYCAASEFTGPGPFLLARQDARWSAMYVVPFVAWVAIATDWPVAR